MIPVRSQLGRYNSSIYIYIYIEMLIDRYFEKSHPADFSFRKARGPTGAVATGLPVPPHLGRGVP